MFLPQSERPSFAPIQLKKGAYCKYNSTECVILHSEIIFPYISLNIVGVTFVKHETKLTLIFNAEHTIQVLIDIRSVASEMKHTDTIPNIYIYFLRFT